MQLFIRNISGQSSSIDATLLSDLQTSVSSLTGIPMDHQRLTVNSRHISGCGNEELASLGFVGGYTVDVSLRLRGGAPKKRCAFYVDTTERCSSASLRIVGDCSFCSSSFCGRHRLPEDHTCANLASVRQEAFERNKSKLEAEQTVGSKLQRV